MRIPFIFSACLLLTSSFVLANEEPAPPKVVEVMTAAPADLRQSVRLFGTVHAKREVTLVAEVDGVLDTTFPAGAKVEKGQVFATLDNPDTKKSYELAQGNEKIALEQYNRAQGLNAKHQAVSQKTVEIARSRWIDANQGTLKAKTDYEKTQFEAPFSGILGVFKMREGAYVQKGDRIVTLYDPNELVLEFEIPAKFLQTDVRKALVKEKLYTTVRTQGVVDTQTNTAPAYLDLEGCETCLVGTVLDIDLVIKEALQTLYVPSESIFMEGKDSFVYVVVGTKAKKRKVQVGFEDGGKVQLISGIKAGEQIVSRNPGRLSDDQDIQVAKA